MRLFPRAVVTVMALAVVSLPVGLTSPSVAAPATKASQPRQSKVPCKSDQASLRTAKIPRYRMYRDTSPVTAKDLQALPAPQTRTAYVNREVRPKLAAQVNIPVYVHVIKGTHKGERNPASRARVRSVITILNRGYSGGESQFNTPTRYRFFIKKIDFHKNEGWYHAYLFGARDQKMKRKLHRGNARTLNLYINGGGPKGSPVLGWSRFPWQYAHTPLLDSVSVNVAGLPGGAAHGYNLGDTVIHETGHWLGLYHTFQGGCGAQGDLVADTPAEAEPSYGCEGRRDTCPDDPGYDPVRDFMDYSLDTCMNRFTPGQVARMDAAFVKWRQ